MLSKNAMQVLSSPKVILLLIFLLGVFVRALPLQYSELSDPDAYFHIRHVEMMVQTHSFPVRDALSEQGRVYSYPPLLHVLLALLVMLSGLSVTLTFKLVGILVGALAGVSVFLLAREMSKSQFIALAAALFTALSFPAILRSAGFVRPDTIALTLIPFLLYLWLTRREKMAMVLSIAMVLLHPLSSAIYAALLISWMAHALVSKQSFPILIPLALAGMLLVFGAWVFSIGLPLSQFFSPVSLNASELGRLFVVQTLIFFPFSWAFGLAGVSKAKMPSLVLAWLVLTFALSSVALRMLIFLVPLLSIAAAYGLEWVWSRIAYDKRAFALLTIFVVALGSVAVWNALSSENPSIIPAEKSAMLWLKDHSSPSQSVLAPWDNGHALAYYAQRMQVIDGYFEFGHELNARNDAMNTALSTSNCSVFTNALAQFHADFFYLPKAWFTSPIAKNGILELPTCNGITIPFSSDGAKIYERI